MGGQTNVGAGVSTGATCGYLVRNAPRGVTSARGCRRIGRATANHGAALSWGY